MYSAVEFASLATIMEARTSHCSNLLIGVSSALPRYLTPDPATLYKSGPQFGTTGVDADVVAAARRALKEMIDYLTTVHGISPYEAMVLCSVAADFKIAEV